MLRKIAAFILCISVVSSAFAQETVGGGHRLGGGHRIGGLLAGPPSDFFASFPKTWVNAGTTTGAGICNTAGYTVKNIPGDYAATPVGIQTAMNAWTSGGDVGILLKIAHGTVIHGIAGDVNGDNAHVSQTVGKVGATKCFVIDSDTPLAHNQTACSHGLPGEGGTRNPGCTTDIASMWTLEDDTTTGGASGFFFGCTNGAQPPNHIVIRSMEWTVQPGTSQSANGTPGGRRGILIDGDQTCHPFDIGVEANYLHGWDTGDAGQPSPACAAWTMSGTVTVTNGSPVLTYASGNSFGMTFPSGTIIINGVSYTVSSSFDPSVSDTLANLTGNFNETSGTYAYTLSNPPARFAHGCGDDVQNAIDANGDNVWVEWNYIEKIHHWNSESHTITFGFSTGPVLIHGNWSEAGSAGIFSGGAPLDTNGGPVQNVLIDGNYIGRNADYKYLTGAAGNSPPPPFGCGPLTGTNHKNCPFSYAAKNTLELKLGNLIVVVANIIENNWADGQDGTNPVFSIRTSSGGTAAGIFDPTTGLPATLQQNIVFMYNIIRNSSQGPGISTRSGLPGDGGGLSSPIKYVDMRHNLFINIGDTSEFGRSGGSPQDLITWGSGGDNFIADMSRTSGVAHATAQTFALSTFEGNLNPPSSIVRSGGIVTVSLGGSRSDPQIGGNLIAANSSDSSYNSTGTPITGVLNTHVATACTTFNNTMPQPCVKADGTFGDAFTYASAGSNGTLCSSVSACKATGILFYIPSLAYKMMDITADDAFQINDLGAITGLTINAAGNSYVVGNVMSVSGGGNYAVVKVTSVDGSGGVTGLSLLFGGYGNITGTKSLVGGVGSGAKITITSVDTSCTDNGYVPTNNVGIAIAPTLATGLDAYYSNSGAGSPAAKCLINNDSGLPAYTSFENNTIVVPQDVAIVSLGVNWQHRHNTITKNIFVSSGAHVNIFCNAVPSGEGDAALNACWDVATLIEGDNILVGRAAVDWDSVFGGAGPNIAFPPLSTVSCSAALADPSCLGFTKFVSGLTFPTAACTYDGTNPYNCPLQMLPWADNVRRTDFKLLPSSSYVLKGADIDTMGTRMVETTYQCPTGVDCGSPLPF